jgi:hypothetical protein
MQFVGLLLIVNSLAGGAWWVATGRPQMYVTPICVAALAAGVFLIVHDRATSSPQTPGATPAQAGGSDELAHQIAEAKTLLQHLEDQTAAADWHLKQLDEHVKSMEVLPDGRNRIGNTVIGQPVVLIPKLEALKQVPADHPAETLALAKECIDLYESTREHMGGVVLASGDIGPDMIGGLYVTAATTAQRMDDHDHALEWARAAVAVRSTPERQFLLVTTLINKNLGGESTAIIQHQLKAGGADAAKFRQLLDQYKIPYKKVD